MTLLSLTIVLKHSFDFGDYSQTEPKFIGTTIILPHLLNEDPFLN